MSIVRRYSVAVFRRNAVLSGSWTAANRVAAGTPLSVLSRNYAVQTKSPRDRAIRAEEVKFVDEKGDFQGSLPLHVVLRSYDTTTHTLVNLTPTQEVPTCRLYSKEDFRELESKAYNKKREKSKAGSDPSKVLKECTLNWNVTEHDLLHKLDSGLSALKKGNKLDISIGMRTKRHARATPQPVRSELVEKVVAMCNEVGKEWKAREGDLQNGTILHYLGNGP